MRVRALFPHFSADGALHLAGDTYELTGHELDTRVSDYIVRPIDEAPVVPNVAQAIEQAKSVVVVVKGS